MARTANSGSFSKGHKKVGGRPKGSTNKRLRVAGEVVPGENLDGEELVRACFAVVRDERATRDEVLKAASIALPYKLPRLSAIEVSGGSDGTPLRIRIVRDEGKKGGEK